MINHIAFVMDGNRRWAQRYDLMPWRGHREGASSLKRVIQFCLEKQIQYASFYTFSLENFKRSEEEKKYLFDLIVQEAEGNISLFEQQGARVRFVGDRTKFPDHVRAVCERIEQATCTFANINISFLFCYGARQEILGAVKEVVRAAKEGRIQEEDIEEKFFGGLLWTHDIPDPDLIIRTGGVRRLSNFLLYQAAYSEFYFMDCLWPEITVQHLEAALSEFQSCKRNFGV